jgi:hypothetical protein
MQKYIKFRPLTYFKDSIFAINLTDTKCTNQIDSIYYSDVYYVSDRAGKWQTEKNSMMSLDSISVAYLNTKIIFDTATHASVNRRAEGIRLLFSAAQNFIFNIETSQADRKIYIYDLLGREIYRSEIPPNTSEWTMDWHKSGQYFVRIGDQSTKFIFP